MILADYKTEKVHKKYKLSKFDCGLIKFDIGCLDSVVFKHISTNKAKIDLFVVIYN